jgi:hypothetical protein
MIGFGTPRIVTSDQREIFALSEVRTLEPCLHARLGALNLV